MVIQFKKILLAAGFGLLIAGGATAQASIVYLTPSVSNQSSWSIESWGPRSFWSASYNFTVSNLDPNSAESINIASLSSTDKAVVMLDGVRLFAEAGSAGTAGKSLFEFSHNGVYTPVTFSADGAGYNAATSLLTDGVNTLDIIFNNTLNSGAMGFNLSGSISYSTLGLVYSGQENSPIQSFGSGAPGSAPASAAPEPEQVMLMLVGLTLIGYTLNKRAKVNAPV
ncbi:MAG: hypothetical protein ABSB19_09175 [Methylomonas sp.]|jgi:hypothetical protein